jgi:uncharacterized protein YndB with AHSA1/START domain
MAILQPMSKPAAQLRHPHERPMEPNTEEIAMNAGQPRPSAGMRRATGRDREEWFGVLDAWGAAGRPYREIADWLVAEHELSKWWAQKLIVEYEEARGLRDPGIRRDGTFEVSASKTVAVPVARLVAAFVDAKLRGRWLPGLVIHRTSQPAQPLRFDWKDGGSRVVATFAGGKGKSQVSVQHQRLRDAKSAAEMKSFWRDRLAALKALLEEADR